MKVMLFSINAWNCYATKNWFVTHTFKKPNVMSDLLLNRLTVKYVCYNDECYGC